MTTSAPRTPREIASFLHFCDVVRYRQFTSESGVGIRKAVNKYITAQLSVDERDLRNEVIAAWLNKVIVYAYDATPIATLATMVDADDLLYAVRLSGEQPGYAEEIMSGTWITIQNILKEVARHRNIDVRDYDYDHYYSDSDSD